jgi:SAM-dependent methyltransferase
MFGTGKAMVRRSYDKRFVARWLVGDGIDIGSGDDPLQNYKPLFPLMGAVHDWDQDEGDAMLMEGVPDERFGFVHSSHCLEHLQDPSIALKNWVRICKPGGHLVLVVPDEDLFEQGVWPSTFNTDHKWSFTIGKSRSWCPKSVNLIDLLRDVLDQVCIIKLELLDINYYYGIGRNAQTMTMMGESAIEIVLRRLVVSTRVRALG